MLAIVDKQIKRNISAHNKYASAYASVHSEIFNPVEQERLRVCLQRAVSELATQGESKWALDFGCGTGNVTRHLLDLDLRTISADVSTRFLRMIEEKFAATGRSETLKLNGKDLATLESARFDVVTAFSVLHHIPDYLRAVRELIRVTKPGGVIYLDHEHSPSYWEPDGDLRTFLRLAKESSVGERPRRPWLSRKLVRLRRVWDRRYQPEGDIHVWCDDHIEWDRIEDVFAEECCEILLRNDYLSFKPHYPEDLYECFRAKCADMRVMAVRATRTAA